MAEKFLSDFARAMGHRFWGEEMGPVERITIDSREAAHGALFVALGGQQKDGHEFAEAAAEKGCHHFLLEKSLLLPGLQVIVPDSRESLSQVAKWFHQDPSAKLAVYGVTGTKGKTSITFFLESILRQRDPLLLRLGTTGHQLLGKPVPTRNTTPESHLIQEYLARTAKGGGKYAIMEVSSHALSGHRVLDVAFDGAIFTNLAMEHTEFHPTMEEYYQAKKRLFIASHCRNKATMRRVISVDDDYGERLYRELHDSGLEVVRFSLHRHDVEYRAHIIEQNADGSRFQLHQREKVNSLSLPLPGEFNIINGSLAAALLLESGWTIPEIRAGLATCDFIPGRMQRVPLGLPCRVFIDYAHTPNSLESLLKSLRSFVGEGKIHLVFGCGGDRSRDKRPVMGHIAVANADSVIITSDNPRSEDPLSILRDITESLPPGSFTAEPDRRKAIQIALRQGQAGDIVVIAGKGHEKIQIIGTREIPFDDAAVACEVAHEIQR